MKVLAALILGLASILYRLFVFTKVWGYIAVKMFHLPAVTMWQAFAISCLLGIFLIDGRKLDQKDIEEGMGRNVRGILTMSLAWLISWLIFA
jgi:Na+/H+ antiporter NhaC